MKKILFVLLVIAACLVILPMSYNNAAPVTVNYLYGSYTLSLSWLIIGAFIAGVLVALPFFALTGWSWKMRAKGLKKQVDELIKQRKRDEIADEFNQQTKA